MKYVRRHPLVAFFGLAFTVTWGIVGVVWLLSSLGVVSLQSPSGLVVLLLMLAIFAPSLSGIAMTAITGGRAGLRELSGRLLKLRVGLRWYLVVLLGVPAAALLASLLAAVVTDEVALREFDLGSWYLVFPLLLGTLIGGPLGEEIGWRGFALPRLLDRWGFLPASMLLGSLWGLWHLPAFVLPGLGALIGGEYSFLPYLVMTNALAVSMSCVYKGTGGSVALAGVGFHLMVNSARFTEGPATTPLMWLQAFCFLLLALALVVAMLRPRMHLEPAAIWEAGMRRRTNRPRNVESGKEERKWT
ncbi:MAG: CAAX amino terminal protease family protein [uncultured Rubrobacteraceae bacterium]|uniref:CAAX amino terminal protease family protein n=1 Tax=uncultured Rubrobacteraceae bacterium TaxID=349277 RepID=A0A6J4QXX6_9ACTN|nr:MAG: CAAX amino terminal protease family protein [uncultured Rubrobacteraceae bacterium]